MIKRLKKGRIILIGIIIFSLIVLILSIIGHIEDQNNKINTYARLLLEQRDRIEQLNSINNNLEKIVLDQHNEMKNMQQSEMVSVETVPTEQLEEGKHGVNKVLLGVSTAGIFVVQTLKSVGLPKISLPR